jgi:hypothetical protein
MILLSAEYDITCALIPFPRPFSTQSGSYAKAGNKNVDRKSAVVVAQLTASFVFSRLKGTIVCAIIWPPRFRHNIRVE